MENRTFYVYENEDNILCVHRTKKSSMQLFDAGIFVDVAPHALYNENGFPALVLGTYFQLHGISLRYDPFNDKNYLEEIITQGFCKTYLLLVRYSAEKWSESAWYHESSLSRIEDRSRIKQYSTELARLEY